MGRPAMLTRSELESYGITEITADGRVFNAYGELKVAIQEKKSRYGTYRNHCFGIYSTDIYRRNREKDNTSALGTKTFTLARAMWAWFYGMVPANLDVDHINCNSLDDRLENLQLLTRAENLAKRKGHRNQWEASLVKETVADCAKKINERYKEKICLLASEVVKDE